MSKASNRMKRRLDQIKKMSAKQTAAAMNAASEALDRQAHEITALKRILISERAQVIYYTEKYEKFVQRECLDVVAKSFLDLIEAEQEPFVKRAIVELHGADGVEPHEPQEPPKLIIQ